MKLSIQFLILATSLSPIASPSFLPPLPTILHPRSPWLPRPNTTSPYPKYFQEAGSGTQNHYDDRFDYHGVLADDVRQEAQRHMMRAYLQFFKEQNLETWLAHGTLLGWWWNARILPWDDDIDTQISLPTLRHLARHFNDTHYDYTADVGDLSSGGMGVSLSAKRTYLLDINPAFPSRTLDNGDNVIDARWIDISNGLYIDLTAVSETMPSEEPGVWSCKNSHRYKTRDLYPMRETMFEGVIAKIPYAYVRILSEEYQEKALVVTEHEGYRWNSSTLLWHKKSFQEMKQEKFDLEDARRMKLAETAAKKAAKERAKELAKQDVKGGGLPEITEWEDEDGAGFDGTDGGMGALGKESSRRRRRAAVTELLVANLEAEEEIRRRRLDHGL